MPLQHGVFVVGFSYPVVPKGEARIRVQLSAEHTKVGSAGVYQGTAHSIPGFILDISFLLDLVF